MPRLHSSLAGLFALSITPGAVAQDPPVLTDRVDAMLERARAVLVDQKWQWLEENLGRGVLAMIASGVETDSDEFRVACKKMFRARLTKCEAIGWRLVALHRLPADWPGREKRSRADLKLLLRCRKDKLFVGEPDAKPRAWMMDATHAAALGLRAAKAMGHKVQKKVWRGMAERLLEHVADTSSPVYLGADFIECAAVASTITTLSICRHHMPPHEGIGPAIDRLWEHLEKRSELIGEEDRFSPEMHLKLMQAAIASERLEVDGAPWFDLGVAMLRRVEFKGGGFGFTGEPGIQGYKGWHPHNIEATLFLAREYQGVLVPPDDPATLTAISASSSLLDRARTLEAVVQRGFDAEEEVLSALRSSVELRRSLARLAVHRLSGSTFGFRAEMLPGSPEAKAAIREIKAWWPK